MPPARWLGSRRFPATVAGMEGEVDTPSLAMGAPSWRLASPVGALRDALEAERDALQRSMADPAFYRRDGALVAQGRARLEAVQTGIEEAYRRWESLEGTLRDLEAIEPKLP